MTLNCNKCGKAYDRDGWLKRHEIKCQGPIITNTDAADHRYHFIECSCGMKTMMYYNPKMAKISYSHHCKKYPNKEHSPSYRTLEKKWYDEEMRVMSNKISTGYWRRKVCAASTASI